MGDLTYLAHHGVKGQKWYERLYQNKDGSLTPLGRVHYGVGQARKKASSGVKKLASDARTSANIEKKRRQKLRAERLEKKAERSEARRVKRETQKEDRRQKKLEKLENRKNNELKKAEVAAALLAAKEAKKTLGDLKDALDQASLNASRRKVEQLAAKRDRAIEKALLKQAEKELKQETKDAKKHPKHLSKNEIRNMSDEEIADRMDRLKREGDLAKAEFENKIPPYMRKIGDAIVKAGTDAISQVGRDYLTKVGKDFLGLNEDGSTPFSTSKKYKDALADMKAVDEYNDYIRDRERKAANRKQDEADEALKREATRIDNKRKIEDYNRSVEDAKANRARDEEDERLKREATRAQNRRTIFEANRTLSGEKSADDRTKEYELKKKKREDNERRAARYRKADYSIEEIAEAMNMTEAQIKALLYMK